MEMVVKLWQWEVFMFYLLVCSIFWCQKIKGPTTQFVFAASRLSQLNLTPLLFVCTDGLGRCNVGVLWLFCSTRYKTSMYTPQ